MMFRDVEFERRVDRDQAVAARIRARCAMADAPPPPRSCCWPLGEPGDGFRLCDGPIERGSYCAEHAARAYARRTA